MYDHRKTDLTYLIICKCVIIEIVTVRKTMFGERQSLAVLWKDFFPQTVAPSGLSRV